MNIRDRTPVLPDNHIIRVIRSSVKKMCTHLLYHLKDNKGNALLVCGFLLFTKDSAEPYYRKGLLKDWSRSIM